jgi:spermidine synthase
VVVERDPEILALVSRFLPFPDSIEVRIADAREALEAAEPESFGLIISDVFDGAAMPASVAALGFARARLRRGGPLRRRGGVAGATGGKRDFAGR